MKDLQQALVRELPGGAAAASAASAARLVDRAARDGLLDVAYATADSGFGPLIVAATPRGLVRLALPGESLDVLLEQLAARISPRVLEAPARLDQVRRQLDEYLAGRRQRFELPIDWRLSSGFALRVRRATARIPYGRLVTYGQLAEQAGNPRAVRATGSALGRNPIPIVVPCHRVVRTGGHLGGYGGGLEMKAALLRLEGAMV